MSLPIGDAPDPKRAPFASTIGRFEILREIGRGAMGVVYEARDPVLDRTVALKVVQPPARGDEARPYEERFLAEARIAAALHHPGIVVVHDVGRDPSTGALFIALELLRGETLADLGARGPVEWPTVLRLVAQVARALHHAHLAGVVHRDVKPANVVVLPSGEAKVMDFGIARLESASHRLTTTGEFIGTPLYTAPEQAKTEEVDGRADVFSLASVAYTLLTGRAAFLAPTIPGIVHRVVYEEPDPPSRFVPGLPGDVERVLARALAKSPADRYPTAEAFAEDVEDVLAGEPPRHEAGDDLVVVEEPESPLAVLLADVAAAPPPPPAGPVPAGASATRTSLPPPRRRKERRGLVLAAVGAGAGLLALLLWISGRASAPEGRPFSPQAAPTPLPHPRGVDPRAPVLALPSAAGPPAHRLRPPLAQRHAARLRGRRAGPRAGSERTAEEDGARLQAARGLVPRRARDPARPSRGPGGGSLGRQPEDRPHRRQLPAGRHAPAGGEPRPPPSRPQPRVEVTP